MHGTHCHCDSGFVLSDDGTSCDPAAESDSTDFGGDFFYEPSENQVSTGVNNNSNYWVLQAIDDNDAMLKSRFMSHMVGFHHLEILSLMM